MSSDQQPMPGVKKNYDYRKLVFAGETFTLGDCVAIKVCPFALGKAWGPGSKIILCFLARPVSYEADQPFLLGSSALHRLWLLRFHLTGSPS